MLYCLGNNGKSLHVFSTDAVPSPKYSYPCLVELDGEPEDTEIDCIY
jgi:hypothetical protein